MNISNSRFSRSRLFFILFFIFLVTVFVFPAKAQQHVKKEPKPLSKDQEQSVKRDANTLFAAGNYELALKDYLQLCITEPKDPDYNFRLGYCYIMTDIDKAEAVKYLQVAVDNDSKRKEALYYLALANQYAYNFDDAIKYYTEYKEQAHNKLIKDFLNADRQIEMCQNGKELMLHPVNVKIENAGRMINTPQQDYNPYISADGNTLVFSSRRKGSMGGTEEGETVNGADIYWSQWRDSVWSKAKNIGAAVNQQYDEESVWLNLAGDEMIVYMDNLDAYGDIGLSHLKGKTWQHPEMFNANINTKAFETGGTMSPDGKRLIFASDRKDGNLGGRDLYMSTRDNPNGEWGPAKNLGKTVNTKYNEDSPFLWIDGKTLYFASEGHNSMGGSDIFKTVYDASTGTWSEPVNLGYPINTTDDDNSFSMTGDGRAAYITLVKKGGVGDKDIYKVTFTDTVDHPFLTLIKGTVVNEAGMRIPIDKAVLLSKTDKSVVFDYAPSANSNIFVMAVRPGSYILHLEGFNFDSYDEDILVENKNSLKDVVKQIKVHSIVRNK